MEKPVRYIHMYYGSRGMLSVQGLLLTQTLQVSVLYRAGVHNSGQCPQVSTTSGCPLRGAQLCCQLERILLHLTWPTRSFYTLKL